MFFKKLLMPLLCGFAATYGYAQQPDDSTSGSCNGSCCCAGSARAPLGVMTDHIHAKGTWMLGYTYSNAMMQGNAMGTGTVSDAAVYKNYMMAPQTMHMQMHMLMLMYGITDRLTVMAMGGVMRNSMTMTMDGSSMSMPGMVMPMGATTMQSAATGLMDTRVSALYQFTHRSTCRIVGSLGLTLPTGSIDETGTTILGDNQRLAYDMQSGTGSYSLDPDVTYAGKGGSAFWGANIGADLKMNYNSLGYRDGHVYHATAWGGYQLLPYLGATLRAEVVKTATISGADPVIANAIYQQNDPTTVTANYGGTVASLYLGFNVKIPRPVLNRFTLLAEGGLPVYRDVNGLQMPVKSTIMAGLQYGL